MKILYFLRDITDCGGIQQTTCNLINALLQKNDQYEIKTISLYHKSKTPFFDLKPEVEKIALFKKRVDQRLSFFRIKTRLKRVLKSLSYDILVVQGTLFSVYLPHSIWSKKKVIVCEHGYYGMGSVFGLHSIGKRIALRKAKAIVSLTQIDRDVYSSHRKKDVLFEAIPNACSTLDYKPAYNQESRTIVSVGTLDDIKQFDQAVSAASLVLPSHPVWEWHIYGDGPNKSALQGQIDRSGLSDRIKLCGYQNDKRIIFGDKSILVLTSRFEGFGMVLLEALQHKLPVVSYDVNYGPKEIVQNGVNGCLVPANNVKELSNTLSELMEDKNGRIALSNGTEGTIARFSLETIVKQWTDLFDMMA